MVAPVCGLRPSRPARAMTENVPKPTSATWSPFTSAFVMLSITASSARPASDLLMSASEAMASMSSDLFTMIPFDSYCYAGRACSAMGRFTGTAKSHELYNTAPGMVNRKPCLMCVYARFIGVCRGILARLHGACQILLVAERFRFILKRNRQHLIDPFHSNDIKILLDIIRHFLQVALVFLRNNHGLDTAASRCEELFFQPANGQHLTTQRDFTGHGNIGANRNVGCHRDQRRAHGDTGARAVLRCCALGNMYVDVMLIMVVCRYAQHL